MTPNERKALVFLSSLAVVGAGVRFLHAARGAPVADAAVRHALDRQIQAVDSARKAGRTAKSRAGARRPTAVIGGAERRAERSTLDPSPSALDLDRASAAEIERLPRVGPALARRIAADRDSFGEFGSMTELEKVRGVGAAMARTLAPYVTFSGTPRPPSAVGLPARPPKTRPRASRGVRRP